MLGINLSIVEHEIIAYPNVKVLQQKLQPINLQKVIVVKAEVEKLLHVCFIYPPPLIKWVSNLVPVDKK